MLLDKIPHTARSDLNVFQQHRVKLAQKIQPAKVVWNPLASEGFKTNFDGANISKRLNFVRMWGKFHVLLF